MNLRVIVVLFATLAALLAPGSAAASTFDTARGVLPQCTDISFKGGTGQINIRTSATRYVAWNIAMYSSALNDGPWVVDVWVNNRRVDHKEQGYQPHGSISPRDLPANSFVSIEAWHTDRSGEEHYFVPNQCHVP
ncbi:hypothetical protein [Actinomycetospora sp. CA-084318]|uniref:hypothetical protein n=1 Tax=Actinomycetospora sp. CA-084318 TaxID=3239892 RepID=UPI003D98B66E